MANETQMNKIHYLYRITNKINGKIYIGQTVQPDKRWNQHCRDAKNPTMVIHHAINKYGKENFEFEVIAGCRNWEDANESETLFVKEYNSLVPNGYNVALGGYNAPKSEIWKEAIRKWRNSLSEEEKTEINQKQSKATIQQIAEKGHPALGTKRTPEQVQKLIEARKNNPVEYTEEVRRHMSEAHIGIKDSEETKRRKSDSIKEQWKIRGKYDSKKCEAPDCTIEGKAKYKIINGIRYCNKHGLRMLRYGRLDTLQ